MAKPDLEAAIAKTTSVFAERNPMAGNKLPVSEFLKGKELTLRYDDWLALEYRFDDAQKLRWRRAGESAWHEERYESWESAPGVLMFGHLMTGALDHDACSVVMDFDNALVTCLHGTMGTPYMANEAAVTTRFGVIEMVGLRVPRPILRATGSKAS